MSKIKSFKQSDLSRLLLDLHYVGGLIKLLQDYNSNFGNINMVKRLEDDLEFIKDLIDSLKDDKD